MLEKDKILQAVGAKGTVIPKDLLNIFKVDTFIMGASLAELVREGRLMITSVKMGGSPFYYLPEHKQKIQDLNKFLNEKDRRAFALIKEKKILKDIDLTPLQRVSMRAIRDFAKPLEIQSNQQQGTNELFWKWYLLSNEETTDIIRTLYLVHVETPALQASPIQTTTINKQIEPLVMAALLKKEEPLPLIQIIPANNPIIPEKKQEPTSDKNALYKDKIKCMIDEATNPVTISQQTASVAIVPLQNHLSSPDNAAKTTIKETQRTTTLLKKAQKPILKSEPLVPVQSLQTICQEQPKGELFLKLQKHFEKNNITFETIEIIRKEKEIDCIVLVPSPVGNVEYYCKIKAKKHCNDGDLAAAFVTAQTKGLPALFVTTGEITKKAQDMLTTKFKNMKILTLA